MPESETAVAGVTHREYHDPWLPREHVELGAGRDPADFEMRTTAFHVAHLLYGQGFEALFPGGAPLRSNLWSTQSHLPGRRGDLIAATVVGALRGCARLEDVDPRWLRMSQSAVIAPGVRYYMEEARYRESGITYADQHRPGNAFPLVYQRQQAGDRVILAGHHRAAAALGLGRPVKALVVRDDDESLLGALGAAADGSMVISELLRVGRAAARRAGGDGIVQCDTPQQAARVIKTNRTAVVPDAETARVVLMLNGCAEEWAAFATSGRGLGRGRSSHGLDRG